MTTTSRRTRCFGALLLPLLALGQASCSDPADTALEAPVPLGTIAQALTDTDSDGMDDAWETTYFGNLSATSTADADSDGMTNGEEYLYSFIPNVNDAFADADGDRYPNVFEVRKGSDPNVSSSIPTPTYVVNAAGGGTHTTISAALTAANVSNGAYQIIGIAPGVYTGGSNLGLTVASTKPKLLFIGLSSAAKTVIDGTGTQPGWKFQNSAVVSSLTFRNTGPSGTWGALLVDAASKEVRLVDLLVRDNAASTYTPGLHVTSISTGTKVFVVGSTFLNNAGAPSVKQIRIEAGSATLLNTVVWSSTSGTMLSNSTGTTLTTNNCLVKAKTLTGTGNLAGSVDPKLGFGGHLLWDSPLRIAGGTVAQSRIDMDGELRPGAAPDIGADQFTDSDGDELADQWELDSAGNLTTLTSRSQDADADGLSNEGDYLNGTSPVVADTDGDAISDGDELLIYGSNPLATDTDRDDMPDGWEINHGLAPLVANTLDDDDGDRYPNVFEYARSTDPSDGASIPTPTYVVNGAGGGTHTTINAALTAANVANGAYQIIAIAPGVYTGGSNLNLTIASTKPKLLLVGLSGAAKTIIDGAGTQQGWKFQNSAVVSSLTFRNTGPSGTWGALLVDAPAIEVRFVDLLVRDNRAATYTPGLHATDIAAGTKVYVVGSTFFGNGGQASVKQIRLQAGSATLLNTVVWSQTSGTMLSQSSGTPITNNCLVMGKTLTGTGNLAGNVDPKLRADARLRSDSPLRGAGGAVPQSRLDMDGELRSSTPDIGVDQWSDPDGDGLPDAWEVATFGNTTSVLGTADDDNDELSNAGEYDWETDRLNPDVDNDGVMDGVEVALGTNPFVSDADDLGSDINHDGLIDSIGAQLGYQPTQLDSDGDSISNADEALLGTDPVRADSDGDGVPDGTDPFPLDHLVSTLTADPQDVTPPVITLTTPLYAVEQ